MKTLFTLLALLLSTQVFASSALNFGNLGVTATVKTVAWSGYHDGTCAWARTSTSFGDFTADATCNLVQRQNNGFGTVSAGGSVLPEIIFTPDHTGSYWVCAIVRGYTTAAAASTFRLYDGTTEIGTGAQNNNGNAISVPVCGLWNATSTSSTTIVLQGKSASSTLNIGDASGSPAIEWTIYAIGNDANAVQEVYAAVETSCTSSPCTITRQGGTVSNGVSTITRTTTGTYVVNFLAGTFSASPVCTVSANSVGTGQAYCKLSAAGISTSSAGINCNNTSISLGDGGFDIICHGPK